MPRMTLSPYPACAVSSPRGRRVPRMRPCLGHTARPTRLFLGVLDVLTGVVVGSVIGLVALIALIYGAAFIGHAVIARHNSGRAAPTARTQERHPASPPPRSAPSSQDTAR